MGEEIYRWLMGMRVLPQQEEPLFALCFVQYMQLCILEQLAEGVKVEVGL